MKQDQLFGMDAGRERDGMLPREPATPRPLDVTTGAQHPLTPRTRQVFECMKAGHTTIDEVSAALGLPSNQISAAFRELDGKGLIYKTGARRQTRAGAWAQVWAIARSL